METVTREILVLLEDLQLDIVIEIQLCSSGVCNLIQPIFFQVLNIFTRANSGNLCIPTPVLTVCLTRYCHLLYLKVNYISHDSIVHVCVSCYYICYYYNEIFHEY